MGDEEEDFTNGTHSAYLFKLTYCSRRSRSRSELFSIFIYNYSQGDLVKWSELIRHVRHCSSSNMVLLRKIWTEDGKVRFQLLRQPNSCSQPAWPNGYLEEGVPRQVVMSGPGPWEAAPGRWESVEELESLGAAEVKLSGCLWGKLAACFYSSQSLSQLYDKCEWNPNQTTEKQDKSFPLQLFLVYLKLYWGKCDKNYKRKISRIISIWKQILSENL